MNIFAIAYEPSICAQALDDKRVNKMATETSQMVSQVARHVLDEHYEYNGLCKWRVAWFKHPCTQWALYCRSNYLWTIALGYALCDEFRVRHGRDHASRSTFNVAKRHAHLVPNGSPAHITPFADCTELSLSLSITIKYKIRMIQKWRMLYKVAPRWTNRQPPEWARNDGYIAIAQSAL